MSDDALSNRSHEAIGHWHSLRLHRPSPNPERFAAWSIKPCSTPAFRHPRRSLCRNPDASLTRRRITLIARPTGLPVTDKNFPVPDFRDICPAPQKRCGFSRILKPIQAGKTAENSLYFPRRTRNSRLETSSLGIASSANQSAGARHLCPRPGKTPANRATLSWKPNRRRRA